MWYVYIYIYNIYNRILAIKKDEILSFAAAWVDIEATMLRNVRQGKTNIIFFHLYVEYKTQYKWANKTETDSKIKRAN